MASRDRRMAALQRTRKEKQAMKPPRTSCGKLSYATRKAAKDAAWGLSKDDPRPGDESRPYINAYKCLACEAWHVGHSKGPCRYTVTTIKGFSCPPTAAPSTQTSG